MIANPSFQHRIIVVVSIMLTFAVLQGSVTAASAKSTETYNIQGLTGTVSDIQTAVPAATKESPLSSAWKKNADIDLKCMAEWATHYLTHTPRKELDYEPVWNCQTLQCPPDPLGQHDPVVPCDTDVRMSLVWLQMREITGTKKAKDVEAGLYKRLLSYIEPDGTITAPVGMYSAGEAVSEGITHDTRVIHMWGAPFILRALVTKYVQTKDSDALKLSQKIVKRWKELATWDDQGRCWFPGGRGAMKLDGTVVAAPWNIFPACLPEPLVEYWLATGDKEALDFAKASADGIIDGCQPDGISFLPYSQAS